MTTDPIVEEMRQYYTDRVPYHDRYMGYTDNSSMEKLLAPIVELVGRELAGKDVLEIACGTGNWTQVISKRARSVVATDLVEGYLELARKKEYIKRNVTFKAADAYRLDGIDRGFTAAFAADWWSHIPRTKIGLFLDTLHCRLQSGARVVMLDMLRTPELDEWFSRFDHEGNVVQKRTLPNGKSYNVIKNFPTGGEIRERLAGRAVDVEYQEDRVLLRWILAYSAV
jgi:ubiquinone/menaquinone biosynthesis C-methylase UbiE